MLFAIYSLAGGGSVLVVIAGMILVHSWRERRSLAQLQSLLSRLGTVDRGLTPFEAWKKNRPDRVKEEKDRLSAQRISRRHRRHRSTETVPLIIRLS